GRPFMSLARLGDVRRLVSVGPRLPAVAVARLHAVGLTYLGVGGVMSGVLLVVMLLTPAGEVVQQIVRAPLDQVLELLAAPIPPPQPVLSAEPNPALAPTDEEPPPAATEDATAPEPVTDATAPPDLAPTPAPQLPLPLGEGGGGGEGAVSPQAPTPVSQPAAEAALGEQPTDSPAPVLQDVSAE